MSGLPDVPVTPLPLARFLPVIGEERLQSLATAAAHTLELVGTRTIWNINSTASGGGVAEMLADGHVLEADEAPAIAERMRPDTTYVIALLEHTWAIPLRAKIDRAGGSVIEDEWIGIPDLISIGYSAERGTLEGAEESLEEESAG